MADLGAGGLVSGQILPISNSNKVASKQHWNDCFIRQVTASDVGKTQTASAQLTASSQLHDVAEAAAASVSSRIGSAGFSRIRNKLPTF